MKNSKSLPVKNILHTKIFYLLFTMCFVFSTFSMWAHGPGEGGEIEKK